MKISVVIPVLNERESLPATIAGVESADPVHEIIAVDGGSQDGTLEWLWSRQCVRTLSSDRGKGTQLNVGALAATGEVLLFLHAGYTTAALCTERDPGSAPGYLRSGWLFLCAIFWLGKVVSFTLNDRQRHQFPNARYEDRDGRPGDLHPSIRV